MEKIKDKKSEVTLNVIIMILMVVALVSILIFGYKKMGNVQNILSESEINQYKQKFSVLVTYCDDPLNKGDSKLEIIKHKDIDMICILGSDYSLGSFGSFNWVDDNSRQQVANINESGHNIIFTRFLSETSFDIVSSFKIDNYVGETNCYPKIDNEIKLKVNCE